MPTMIQSKFINETFYELVKILNSFYGPDNWIIAGGFVRDFLLEKPVADMDIFANSLRKRIPHVDVLQALQHIHPDADNWQPIFDSNYLYSEGDNKRIQFIYKNFLNPIEIIEVNILNDNFTNYIVDSFDCTLSMVYWTPLEGIVRTVNFIEDSNNKILRFTKNATKKYVQKLKRKYPEYMVIQ